MWRRILAMAVAAGIGLAACGSDSSGSPNGGSASPFAPCGAPPKALATAPEVPQGFPLPAELVLTSEEEAGPSTILEGHWEADLPEVFKEYRSAFETAGYDVPFSEQEERDAEVAFAGGDTTGLVRLGKECEGRTDVTITIRPA